MAWAIATLSLNLILGYTGQASLAHGALMGIGAYAFGILVQRVGLNFWLALPLACLITAFIGLLIGLPSLRTKGPYFAIVTLCFNVIVYKVFDNWKWLSGGIQGQAVPQPAFLQQRWARYYFVLGCLVLTLLIMRFIVKSLLGVTFMSIRSNENLAEAVGINSFRNKLLSFVVSCFFVGLAGLHAGPRERPAGPHHHHASELLLYPHLPAHRRGRDPFRPGDRRHGCCTGCSIT